MLRANYYLLYSVFINIIWWKAFTSVRSKFDETILNELVKTRRYCENSIKEVVSRCSSVGMAEDMYKIEKSKWSKCGFRLQIVKRKEIEKDATAGRRLA